MDPQKRPSRRRWLVVLLVASVAANLAIVVGSYAKRMTARPTHCGSCHSIAPKVESYQSGLHLDHKHRLAGVGCKDCHVTYTVWKETRMALRSLTGGKKRGAPSYVFDMNRCSRCHIGIEHLGQKTDFLRANPHDNHLLLDACGECHRVHDAQIDYCGTCHENGHQRMTEDDGPRDVCAPFDSEVPET